MISCNNITFKYPQSDFVFQLKNMDIKKGQQTAIIGPSGCGKTTFINLISGILKPDSGVISVDDITLSDFNKTERQDFRIVSMGLIFQEFELLDYLSVFENILLPYRINSLLSLDKKVKERAKILAERVGLGDKITRYPKQLSQGERQRVAICRALIAEPKVLLCDEPTANLDPVNRDNIIDILTSYCQDKQTTLVVVTHDHEILPRFKSVINLNPHSS
ncbi:ABC transporter ATP-binding protein [Tamlana haliotis]|uniref:ABC transporter ATP-binding protein n=2 Tax=Pseudotamlana haliotis TaxID=2614804 RepID=A0A6N6MB54_9FLAO|nr:ABC transporter ATP-binding protein [Tamlana haliotis]